MRITFPRFDAWFTKGFDGLRNLLMDRSGKVCTGSPELLDSVRQLIKVLESLRTVELDSPDEVTDQMFAEGTKLMSEFLEYRLKYGKLPESITRDLLGLYHPLQTILTRLENGEPS